MILPELESASGETVTAKTIYINLFPLFIEAKDLKVLDRKGNHIITATRVKGYVNPTGFLSRHIFVRRLVVNDPLISTNGRQIEEIIRNVKAYLDKERTPVFKVKLKVIEIVKGNASLGYEGNFKGTAGIKGLSGELTLGETQRLRTSIKELVIEKQGWPRIACNIDTSLVLKDGKIEIKRIEIGSYGSKFSGEGSYAGGGGALKTKVSLLVGSVKRIFNLSREGEGTIRAQGEIRLEGKGGSTSIRAGRTVQPATSGGTGPLFPGVKNIFVNLKLGGNMHIETLMELLKVKEKIEGLIDFQGELKGRLSSLSGMAEATLQKGNLFGVDIDSLTCKVLYKDGVMDFQDISGRVYNGAIMATASINLPVVNFFTVDVKVHSADSGPLLELIRWEPPIAPGKVDGELSTSGGKFNPEGSFVYKALNPEQRAGVRDHRARADDFLDRIKDIKGSYSLRDDILSLSNLLLNTPVSGISANGSVDLKHKTLFLKSRLHTDNVADLALPYYKEVKGQAEFTGEVTGPFDDPSISGRAALSNVSIEGYMAESVRSDFVYRRNLLAVREAVFKSGVEEHSMKGRISFPRAKELFELSRPDYDLTASIRDAKFGQFARIFYKDFQASGRFSTDAKIGGKDGNIEISGEASIDQGSIYNVAFDSASGAFSYVRGELSLRNIAVRKGQSIVAGKGRVGPDKKFSYSAASGKLFLRDIDAGSFTLPVDAALKVRSEGQGTFDDPAISLKGTFTGGTFRGGGLGSGSIDALLRNRSISVTASLFDGKMRVKGKAYINDQLPWSAEVYVGPGRYDSIIGSLVKDTPEDLHLGLDGHAEIRGDRNSISATADIKHVALSLFGQTLTNESAVRVSVNDRKVSFREFAVKSGASSFKLQGGLEIGRGYDIRLSGSSSLSPFKALSKKIGYLKGDSGFSLSIMGKWDKPEINGSMNVSDASFGLHDYPLYVTSVNGSLFMEGDRIVIKALSGKVGGGTANISGVAYLNALQIKRFYLETKLDDVTVSVSKDFHVNFGGDLLYKGTSEKMNIIGDIKINRARYKEPLEWRSWLFTARAAEKPRAELTAFEKAELNISVTSGENISIDNNIARASVKIAGEMLIKGTVSRPVLFGRIETTEGYVYFRNNEFKLTSASVDFADPNRIKPVINLTSETTIQGYRIILNLEGQTDRFDLSLASQPHLEDRDILALLTSGQIGAQIKGLEAGIGAGEAASFLTGKLQDVFEERLRALTGVDRFQVEPYVSSTTGSVGPRVTVSKRLIGEKLFVTYANLLGTTEEQVIKIEYFLNKKLSLVGLRDETGSMGGDVRFRFEFK
jgi:hypothetical protein